MLSRFKMLMNAQDGSPGNGAASTVTGAPTQATQTAAPTAPVASPQAQGGALTLDQVRELFASMSDQVAAKARDGVFAELRRAGQFKGAKADPEPATTPVQPGTQQPFAQEDAMRLIARERAFNRATAGTQISEGVFRRMETAFQREQPGPEETASWVKAYLDDIGVKPAAAPAATPTPIQATPGSMPAPTGPTVSNTGGPAPAATPTGDVPLVNLSEEDRKHMLKQLGPSGYRKRFWEDMRAMKIKVRNY